ncbi:MAG: hypothetical protein D8M52_01000 [Chlorobi bacterium]|nr:MAG: hypothetical protein F9K28_00250 [Bacteroidota bacterium]KXK35782.1 MAG: hypothetical protein UZ06_CHB003000247 [Chlorobi bacterium OLB6]MBL1160282.1 hypothetical protein [Chlorobiota bacterium]MBW7853420.1 hypothetical protein [Candidatus Kapabacteria bacterium]MCL4276207.1 hypothetical protein [Ignavibacteria bacterium]
MKSCRNLVAIVTMILMIVAGLASEAYAQRSRGGGSFGGSRGGGGSFGAPRSMPRSVPSGGGSFGGSRRSPSAAPSQPYSNGTTPRRYSAPRATPGGQQPAGMPSYGNGAFGGTRLSNSQQYTSRYGLPRKTETRQVTGTQGAGNYQFQYYGGMGDRFMMGYFLGSIPWYYSMPFHPAFYYSAPYTVKNTDGSVSVYPGTFQWGELFFVLLLVGGLGFIIYVWLKNKRRRAIHGGVDMSRSSFG